MTMSFVGIVTMLLFLSKPACALQTDTGSAQEGKALIMETRTKLPDHVGNALNCSNCHLDAGTRPFATPFNAIWRDYPAYEARSGKVISLADRVNGCFLRSMNGKALDENSTAMRSILAYIESLPAVGNDIKNIPGRGMGPINTKLHADPVRGQQIFASQCASCHGANGLGASVVAGRVVPPLWGPNSFNDGAGMARTGKAAAFVLHNMPLGRGNTLSDQDALDVAAFFTHQPRPVYARKSLDWPNGKKPVDARD